MRIFLIITGMALVTYIPRLLPVFVMDRFRLPGWAKRWLSGIPYAALGALIFPGILSIESGKPLIGLAGGVAAAIAAWYRVNVMIVVVISIITVMLLKLIPA